MLKNAQIVLISVAKLYGIKPETIVGRSRKSYIVEARYLCCKIMRNILKMSYSQIVDTIDRDHSSIIKLLKNNKLINKTENIYKKYLTIISNSDLVNINLEK